MDNTEINITTEEHKRKPFGLLNLVLRGIRSVLGGTFLKDFINKTVSLKILLLVMIGILYIFNSYIAEKKARKIQKLQPITKELDYDYKTMRTKRRDLTKQSTIAKSLKQKGIEESTSPPNILITHKDNKK